MEVDCRTVKSRLDAGEDFLLLDCREPPEYNTVCIDGAQLLPMSEIPQRLDELEPHRNSTIIVHCHHGGRSLQLAMWLRQQGWKDTWSMAGGIDRWAQEIDPALPRY